MRFNRAWKNAFLLFFATVMIAGCSQKAGSGGEKAKEEAGTDKQKIATTIEEIVEQGAGTYSGDKYDPAKVEAELDKIPEDASDEEVFNTIVSLIGEDYGPVKDAYDNFDPTFKVSGDQPGRKNAGGQGSRPLLYLPDARGDERLSDRLWT